jgi:hypothetical protein
MGLITCKDCKTQISSQAKSCPKCGRPITQMGCLHAILIVIIIFILFAIGVTVYDFFYGIEWSHSQNNNISQKATTKIIDLGGKTGTMDGHDTKDKSWIAVPNIGVWNDSIRTSTSKHIFKIKHGEKVKLLKRQGDRILIENKKGQKGWVTDFFIKEFKKSFNLKEKENAKLMEIVNSIPEPLPTWEFGSDKNMKSYNLSSKDPNVKRKKTIVFDMSIAFDKEASIAVMDKNRKVIETIVFNKMKEYRAENIDIIRVKEDLLSELRSKISLEESNDEIKDLYITKFNTR